MAGSKFISLLGFARKAGKLILGYDRIKDSGKKFKLIIICSDVSERTRRNAKLFAQENGRIFESSLTMHELGKILGAEKVGVAAVDDINFATALLRSEEQ